VEYVASQKFNKVYPDPENASVIESLKRKGVNVREVKKGKGSVISGISLMHEMLKQGRLIILAHCKNTIQAFETYHYAETSKGKNYANELPDHEGSDMLDAIRYVLMTDAPNSNSNAPKVHYGSQHRPNASSRIKFNRQ